MAARKNAWSGLAAGYSKPPESNAPRRLEKACAFCGDMFPVQPGHVAQKFCTTECGEGFRDGRARRRTK